MLHLTNLDGELDTAYAYGNERLTVERFTGWTGYYTYAPRGSVSGVTDADGGLWASYQYNATGKMTFGEPEYNQIFLTEDTYLGNLIKGGRKIAKNCRKYAL